MLRFFQNLQCFAIQLYSFSFDKGKVKDPRYMQNKKDSRISLTCAGLSINNVPNIQGEGLKIYKILITCGLSIISPMKPLCVYSLEKKPVWLKNIHGMQRHKKFSKPYPLSITIFLLKIEIKLLKRKTVCKFHGTFFKVAEVKGGYWVKI